MAAHKVLLSIASWLEDSDNECLYLADADESSLAIVAEAFVKAADALRGAADEVKKFEQEESSITPESISELAEIATAFDQSDDPKLIRQAAVIDELLMTIAKPANSLDKNAAEQKGIDTLKEKYHAVKSKLDDKNKVKEARDAIEKAVVMKTYRPLEAPLQTRYCPDHAGAHIRRIDENVWQCDLDKKKYDFSEGFTLESGEKVPATSVAEQTNIEYQSDAHTIFDNREERTSRG